jgi:hypothetical protein
MLIPAIAEVLAGLIVLWLAIRMRQGRVSRGSAAGVRTRSTMRSDAAFETANKAAAPVAGQAAQSWPSVVSSPRSCPSTWRGPSSSAA